VTGASTGIGEQFARILAERGHDVILVARDQARLEAVAKDITERYGGAHAVTPADLTAPSELATVEEVARGVDVLVNNAGFGTFGAFHELSLDGEDREVRLNVVAVVRLAHAAAAGMAERRRGGILNVASIAGFQPIPTNATYAATKAFVISFSQALHEELRPAGVDVTVLCPGFTRSEFQERAGVPSDVVPGPLWQDADQVARAGLDGLSRRRAVVVPGALNRTVATLTSMTPDAISRRVSAAVMKRGIG
jgi:short-subunit dehydrogenase